MSARKMKDSGIEWIGEIPEEWRIIPHKYVMHKEKRICEQYNGESIISLSMQGVHIRDLDAGGKMPTTFDGYQYVEPEDMLLCLFDIDVTPRCVGIVHDDGLTSPAYSRFKVHNGSLNRYYDYLLRFIDDGKIFVHLAKNLRSSLTETDFGAIKTLAPPLSEQRRIADFLDAKCAEIDRVAAETEKTIEEYKVLKQSVITEAVTHGVRGKRPMKDSGIEWIGEIPEEWKTIRVKYLLKERNERSEFGLEEPLSMSQKLGLIPTKDMDMVPNMASSFVGAKLAHMDDLVFNKLKAHLGVFSVSRYNGLVSPDYAVYYSTGKVNLKYLEYLFKTPQCISEFRKKSTGIAAGLTRLYTDGLFSVVLPFPSLCEQEEVVAELDRKCAEIDRLVAAKQDLLAELATYKKSVIYEFVTGKKEVPECL